MMLRTSEGGESPIQVQPFDAKCCICNANRLADKIESSPQQAPRIFFHTS